MDFYLSLEPKTQEKIEFILDLIRKAERVPSKFLKHIEGSDGLFEIRATFRSNIFRIFCFFDDGKLVVLLNGFKKKTQKTQNYAKLNPKNLNPKNLNQKNLNLKPNPNLKPNLNLNRKLNIQNLIKSFQYPPAPPPLRFRRFHRFHRFRRRLLPMTMVFYSLVHQNEKKYNTKKYKDGQSQ